MDRWVIGRVILATAAAGAAALSLLTAIRVAPERMFFRPDRSPADLDEANLPGFVAHTLVTSDQQRIAAWWRPPDPGVGVVLYLHGNGANLASPVVRMRDLAATGAGVLAIDYRGYGGSTGAPSERGVNRDARAAWAFLQREAPGRPVVIWGQSMGAGVAVQIATEVDEAGVILDSPFSSMRDLTHAREPMFPAFLLPRRFDNAEKIGRIGSPLVVAHCDADRTVPLAQGEAVYAAARPPKQFIRLEGCSHAQTWRAPAKAAILAFLHERIGARID